MKTQKLLNPVTNDTWYCDDINLVKEIEGVQYISVYKENPSKTHYMRKEVLQTISTPRN